MSVRKDKRRKYDAEPTALGFLCHTVARRKILDYILAEIIDGNLDPRMTGAVMDATGLSRNSVTEHIDVFVDVGLLDTAETDKKFTQYTPVDGRVAETLLALDDGLRTTRGTPVEDGTAITHLYGSDSRRILTDFFVFLGHDYNDPSVPTEGHPTDDPLTKQKLYDECGVTRKTIIEEIETLVEYGIVATDTSFSYPRYYPAIDSNVFEAIIDTNDTLFRALQGA